MRHSIRRTILTTALALALIPAAAAGARAQKACPTIELDCSERTTDDKSPVRCTVDVSGDDWTGLVYQWSVSIQASIKIPDGRPNEAELDLGDSRNQAMIVTVTVRGLPSGCPNTGNFDSRVTEEEEDSDIKPTSTASSSSRPAPGLIASCASAVAEGAPAYFGINVGEVDSGTKLSYRWMVSAGRIKGGQKGQFIAVDTADLGNQIVKATVEVSGLGPVVRASCTTRVTPEPKAYRLDELKDRSADEEELHLRRFALRLNIGLDERAYIVAYGRRGQSADEIRGRAERARAYLLERFNVNPARVEAIGGGIRKDSTLELWVVQSGATPPRWADQKATGVKDLPQN